MAEKAPVVLTPQMKTVVDYLSEYGEMSDEDLQELLSIKKTRAYLLARQMNEDGLVDIIGRGTGKKYRLKWSQRAVSDVSSTAGLTGCENENLICIARVFNVSTDFPLGEVNVPNRIGYGVSELGQGRKTLKKLKKYVKGNGYGITNACLYVVRKWLEADFSRTSRQIAPRWNCICS